MSEFKREENYDQSVIEEVNELMEDGLLVIPNADCFKAYSRGLTVVYEITNTKFTLLGSNTSERVKKYKQNHAVEITEAQMDEFVERFLSKKKYTRSEALDFYRNNSKDIIRLVGFGMKRDKERMSSQKISLYNMTFDDDKYSVCGWETAIPEEYALIPSRNKKAKRPYKTPEIDLVVVNPSKKEMIWVEYKCKGKTMLNGNQSIRHHCKDYMKVLHCSDNEVIRDELHRPKIEIIRDELLKAYNVMRRVKGKNLVDKDTFSSYTIKVGFLFVDKAHDEKGNVVSSIEEGDYRKGMKRFETYCKEYLDDLVYIRAESEEKALLQSWKPIKGSGLALTVK